MRPVVQVGDEYFTVLKFHSQAGETGKSYISISRAGTDCQASLPCEIFDGVVERYRKRADCEENWLSDTILKCCKDVRVTPQAAGVLARYIELHAVCKPKVYSRGTSVKYYTFGDREGKPTMHPLMPAFDPNCYVPMRSKGNDQTMIVERDVKYRARVHFPKKHLKALAWFKTKFAEDLTPAQPEQVYAAWKTPNQRRDFLMTSVWYMTSIVQFVFMKVEAYSSIKFPRIISTSTKYSKNFLKAFGDAVSSHAKATLGCYGPKSTPAELTKKVADVCHEQESVYELDHSKLDAHLQAAWKDFISSLLHGCFKKWSKFVMDLWRERDFVVQVTRNGVRIIKGDALSSGNSLTSFAGTIVCCAFWFLCAVVAGFSYEEAWFICSQCVFFGDDSVLRKLPLEVVLKTASELGLEVEIKEIPLDGSTAVGFLSRKFDPLIGLGTMNSCCDIKRQLSKLHVSKFDYYHGKSFSELTGTQKAALYKYVDDKFYAYWLTDRNTPLIGHIVNHWFSYRKKPDEGVVADDIGWWSQYSGSSQFPNQKAPWIVAQAYEAYDEGVMDRLRKILAGIKCTEDFFKDRVALIPYEPDLEAVALISGSEETKLPVKVEIPIALPQSDAPHLSLTVAPPLPQKPPKALQRAPVASAPAPVDPAKKKKKKKTNKKENKDNKHSAALSAPVPK